MKYHFLHEAEKDGEVHLVYCNLNDQVADILTKALPKCKFKDLRVKLGLFKRKLKKEC